MKEERTIRQLLFPYLLKNVGQDLWIALNREYKPLGYFPDKWVEYENHRSVFGFKLTEKFARQISYPGSFESVFNRLPSFDFHWPNSVYFYNDASSPSISKKFRDDYFRRLSLFLNKKVGNPWIIHD